MQRKAVWHQLNGGAALTTPGHAPRIVSPPPQIAAAATFTATDFAWEQVQESALRAFRAGGAGVAAKHWRRGLTIAGAHFAASDPRLATSLTNAALVARRAGELHPAAVQFAEALAVWERSSRWVRLMAPLGHPDACYDEGTLALFETLVAQGRAATAAIERHGPMPVGGLERWRRERPQRGSDLRKLLGAVFLIASRPG